MVIDMYSGHTSMGGWDDVVEFVIEIELLMVDQLTLFRTTEARGPNLGCCEANSGLDFKGSDCSMTPIP